MPSITATDTQQSLASAGDADKLRPRPVVQRCSAGGDPSPDGTAAGVTVPCQPTFDLARWLQETFPASAALAKAMCEHPGAPCGQCVLRARGIAREVLQAAVLEQARGVALCPMCADAPGRSFRAHSAGGASYEPITEDSGACEHCGGTAEVDLFHLLGCVECIEAGGAEAVGSAVLEAL